MAGSVSGTLWFTKHVSEKIIFTAALCEWLATLLILCYVLTLLPQLHGIEISLPVVTSGHSHKGFLCSASKNKVDVEQVVVK